MSSDWAPEEALFEDYLHGRLGGAEREAFERRYFEDQECFARLQAFLDLRRELEAPAPARLRSWNRPLPAWALSAAAGLVVALGATVLVRSLPPRVDPRTSPSPIPSTAPSPVPVEPLNQGAIESPAYYPLALRGASASARAFREAMEPYRVGDWRATIAGLEPLARSSPEAADVRFFLGACYLLTGRDAEAAGELQAVVLLGPSPYLEEAHVYRARALLRLGDTAAARAELQAAVALGGDLEPIAGELLRRLDDRARGR